MTDSKSDSTSQKLIFGGSPPSLPNISLIGLTVLCLLLLVALMNIGLANNSSYKEWEPIITNAQAFLAVIGFLACVLVIIRNVKNSQWFWAFVSLVQLPVYVGGIFITITSWVAG